MPNRIVLLLLVGFLALFSSAQVGAEEPAAVRGLRIEIGQVEEAVAADARFVMTLDFRNTGHETLELYLPLHASLVPFPRWTFTAESGAVYVPSGSPFQSMFRKGLQGSILRLAPGARHTHTLRIGAFRKLDAGGTPNGDPLTLPPGTYTVNARYFQSTNAVPYAETMGPSHLKLHEGLWTGDVSSQEIVLRVEPGKQPVLTLQAPAELHAGGPLPLRVTLANQGKGPLRVRAALELGVGTKAFGSGFARFVIQGNRLVPVRRPGAIHTIELDAGMSLTRSIDLAAIDMRLVSQMGHLGAYQESTVGLHDVVGEGAFRISAHLVDEGGNTIAEGGIRRLLRPLALRDDVLEVRVERKGTDHRQAPIVDVIVANKSATPVRLPAGLHYPTSLFFSLEAPGKRGGYRVSHVATRSQVGLMLGQEPNRRARIAEGLAWRLGACEPRVNLAKETTVLLPPGGELRRRFHLADLVDAGERLRWGPFQLTAYFQNRESGARMGQKDFFVGMVVSKPVEVRGGAW